MQKIQCPNCGEFFQVDENSYAQIAQQVRDKEFEKALNQQAKNEVEKACLAKETEYQKVLREKDSDRADLQQQLTELQKQLQGSETEKKLAVNEAVQQKEREYSDKLEQKKSELADLDRQLQELQAQLQGSENDKKLAVNEAVQQKEREYNDKLEQKKNELADRDRELEKLRAQLQSSETEKKLAVSEAEKEKNQELAERSNEITVLQGKLRGQESETELKLKSQKEKYEEQLRQKDEQISFYKDFKARQSTKMIGESLEQHCLTQFNTIRMTAFPTAYFEKDNDTRTGSKGDFIFRESAEDGTEFISIMFEMKNEMDETATKHKNEDFFRELDKDRREKGCEYAVLVSLLEADSELYNSGIVDVSYKYEKMYVIRPQFFIPMITLLRNAARNSLHYRQELQIVRSQQMDITNFEKNMNDFKEGFARNYRLASERFKTAIEEIDKTIDHLQKTKNALLSSENNLRLANNKADELSIKRLTKNAPTVKAMFDDLQADTQA